MFSAFNLSGLWEQWAADTAASGEQLRVRCLAQGSHLSRGHFLPEPGFKPTTLVAKGFKSNSSPLGHDCLFHNCTKSFEFTSCSLYF